MKAAREIAENATRSLFNKVRRCADCGGAMEPGRAPNATKCLPCGEPHKTERRNGGRHRGSLAGRTQTA